jgi:crotonobetainyl-CoA:carnitine CoA-transferase CaiB-like acyl-CoA transferase
VFDPEKRMSGPLDGVVVLDFTQLAQGPYATQILGDLGADVIKVEPPGGDWMRAFSLGNLYRGGESVSYLCFNRNKRSIKLDLKKPQALEVALRLAKGADVVVENFRPGVMDRLGLGYDALSQLNPRLIFCSSSGFGDSGPYVKRPGQDLLVQALSGYPHLNGRAQDPPTPSAVGIADLVAAQHIVYGVCAALFNRERTGRGQRVCVNLYNSLLALIIQELTTYLNGGEQPPRASCGIPNPYLGAPYGLHRTADGYIAIAMNPLDKLGPLLGLKHYETLKSSNAIEDRDRIFSEIGQVLVQRTTRHWMDVLLPHDIWCAPLQTFADLERDPQVAHNEMIAGYEHPSAGSVRTTGIAVKFMGTPGAIRRPAPMLGEHTDEILRQHGGYGIEQIAALRHSGALG